MREWLTRENEFLCCTFRNMLSHQIQWNVFTKDQTIQPHGNILTIFIPPHSDKPTIELWTLFQSVTMACEKKWTSHLRSVPFIHCARACISSIIMFDFKHRRWYRQRTTIERMDEWQILGKFDGIQPMRFIGVGVSVHSINPCQKTMCRNQWWTSQKFYLKDFMLWVVDIDYYLMWPFSAMSSNFQSKPDNMYTDCVYDVYRGYQVCWKSMCMPAFHPNTAYFVRFITLCDVRS